MKLLSLLILLPGLALASTSDSEKNCITNGNKTSCVVVVPTKNCDEKKSNSKDAECAVEKKPIKPPKKPKPSKS